LGNLFKEGGRLFPEKVFSKPGWDREPPLMFPPPYRSNPGGRGEVFPPLNYMGGKKKRGSKEAGGGGSPFGGNYTLSHLLEAAANPRPCCV